MNGMQRIATERKRQLELGFGVHHDDQHEHGELAQAALCYECDDRLLTEDGIPYGWPWDEEWWKPTPDNRVRELMKAGALYAAEKERVDRRIASIATEIDRLLAVAQRKEP